MTAIMDLLTSPQESERLENLKILVLESLVTSRPYAHIERNFYTSNKSTVLRLAGEKEVQTISKEIEH